MFVVFGGDMIMGQTQFSTFLLFYLTIEFYACLSSKPLKSTKMIAFESVESIVEKGDYAIDRHFFPFPTFLAQLFSEKT